MKKILSIMAIIATPLLIAGCTSSGGTTKLTSFSNIKPSTTYRVTGVGSETTYTNDATGTVTSVGPIGAAKDATAEISYDSRRFLTALTIDDGTSTKSWNLSKGDLAADLGNGVVALSNPSGTKVALVGDPNQLGYNYQSFGLWSSGNTTSGAVGLMSAGYETNGNKVPVTSTGTFTGQAGGLYVDGAGDANFVLANANLTADFANRTASFSTTGSQLVLPDGTFVANAPNLDLSAPNLSYASGSNAFSGTVTNAGLDMTGNVDGRFYGPSAQEAGGVFGLKGAGTQAYGGAFGAKR